jgi:hypothetical protein
MTTKPLRKTGAALGLTGEAGRNALNRMKALFKTVANLVWPDPNEPELVWKRSDYVALFIIALALAALIAFS